MLEVRYRPRYRFPEKGDRGHVGGQKLHQPATEMPLEQIVFFQIRQIDRHQLAPIIGRHDPIERVLVAEKEAQRHTGGFRQVYKKEARTRRRPENRSVHRFHNLPLLAPS
jgi:hypothetical protein